MATFGDALAGAAVEKARRTRDHRDVRRAAALVCAHLEETYQELADTQEEAAYLDRLVAFWRRYGHGKTAGQILDEFAAVDGAAAAGGAR